MSSLRREGEATALKMQGAGHPDQDMQVCPCTRSRVEAWMLPGQDYRAFEGVREGPRGRSVQCGARAVLGRQIRSGCGIRFEGAHLELFGPGRSGIGAGGMSCLRREGRPLH